MTDDYFGGSATPQAGWQPVPVASPTSTGTQPSLGAIGLMVAGALTCVGAIGPWLHASAYGQTFSYSGMHSRLDGGWLLAVGFVGAALGLVLLVGTLPREARAAISAIAVVLGIVGLILVIHEHGVLSNGFHVANEVLGSYLNIHFGTGWGLWLAGFGCVALAGSGVAAYLL